MMRLSTDLARGITRVPLTIRLSSGNSSGTMFELYREPWFLAAVLLVLSCTPSYREGLPPGSPFASPSAATSKALPQGITIADVTSQSALLWLRTEGSLRIQVE